MVEKPFWNKLAFYYTGACLFQEIVHIYTLTVVNLLKGINKFLA